MEQEKYFISVSEPWDFESKDGQNVIRGNILNIRGNQCLVFKSNHYLKFDDIEGNVLILTPRHQGNDFSELNNEFVVVNGSILVGEYNEGLSEKDLQSNSKFKIIGSIRKEKSSN